MNLKRKNKSLVRTTLFLTICFMLFVSNILATPYSYRLLNAVYPSASEEQRCLLIDKEGLIWIGSDGGIKSYDGYHFKTYRSDATSPNILPSNTVLAHRGQGRRAMDRNPQWSCQHGQKDWQVYYSQPAWHGQPYHLFPLYLPRW